MPIWNTISVTEQPELTLISWSIYELPNKDRHFVGWASDNREGRVSSRIEQFDVKLLTGITSSGRCYKLVGKPGRDKDAEYTWNRWKNINNVEKYLDVSQVIWTEHQHAFKT